MGEHEDSTFTDLVEYVNAVADLAAAIESDLRAGDTYTSKTVAQLNRLIIAAGRIESILSHIGKIN